MQVVISTDLFIEIYNALTSFLSHSAYPESFNFHIASSGNFHLLVKPLLRKANTVISFTSV